VDSTDPARAGQEAVHFRAVFERLIERADAVLLALPMGAFEDEGDGEIRFRIPRSRR
jgi:hypothetical protein